jgi:hypothetical protein
MYRQKSKIITQQNITLYYSNLVYSIEQNSAVLTASQMTAGKADLLKGTWTYPCFHKFCWILDYLLPRTERRAPGVHECPKCIADPSCLVCFGRFDSKSESCTSCEQFFVVSLLQNRRRKLVALNV